MMPPSSTEAANIHQPVNNNFWASDIHSVQEGSPVDWPLSMFPLAQQQFYQEVNQQQKKRRQQQQQQQMKDQNRRNNKIRPTSSRKHEMLSHSESLNFNSLQNRKSGKSFSNQDLTKLGQETSIANTKCLDAIQEQTITNTATGLTCPSPFTDAQLGQSGGVATSSTDSFISACSVRHPSGANVDHSLNNSNGGGTGSSHSTAPIFIASNPLHQPPFHTFNHINSQHHSPVGTNNYQQSYSISQLHKIHRGELSLNEKYYYDLSRAQLKASSRTSALLSGFAMIALVELQYLPDTPKPLLIMLGVVTTLLVSVHLLALMMSTCLLPYIEANGCTRDSPHIKLKFYIELSWIFSTCIGLLLFLLEIGVIFFVKFNAIGYIFAAYITTGMLVPVLIIFIVISYLIHRNRFTHSIERVNDKVVDLQKYLVEAEVGIANHQTTTTMMQPQSSNSIHRNMANAGLQGVTVVKNIKD